MAQQCLQALSGRGPRNLQHCTAVSLLYALQHLQTATSAEHQILALVWLPLGHCVRIDCIAKSTQPIPGVQVLLHKLQAVLKLQPQSDLA